MICPLSGRQVKYQYRISAFLRKMRTLGRKIRALAEKCRLWAEKYGFQQKICLQAFFFCVSIDFAWFRVNKIHAV